MLKKKERELNELKDQLSVDPNIDLNSFEKIVRSLSKLSEEKLAMVVNQVGNFTDIVKTYMDQLGGSIKHSNELIEKNQEALIKQLDKEDSPEIRMQILVNLRELQKQADKQLMIDKLHLDKVAAGATAVIGAVVVGIIKNKGGKS